MRKYRFIKLKAIVLLLVVCLLSSAGFDIAALAWSRYAAELPGNTGSSEKPVGIGAEETPGGRQSTLGAEAVKSGESTGGGSGESSGTEEDNPIEFSFWDLDNGGVISQSNMYWFMISAVFASDEDIASIDYLYSVDGATWVLFEDYVDYGLYKYDGKWYRYIYADMTGLNDGAFSLRAVAATEDRAYTLTVDCMILKDTLAPDATGFSVAPNEDNTGLVLSWTNPDHDFAFVKIYRWETGGGWELASAAADTRGDYTVSGASSPIVASDIWDSPDGSNGYWRSLGETAENTYTDYDVLPDTTYHYMAVVYDQYENASSNPPRASGKRADQPIYLYYMDVYANNPEYAYIDAAFLPGKADGNDETPAIISIEYEWSSDGTTWQPFDEGIIIDDWGLYWDEWVGYWSRYIAVNLSGFPDGNYAVKATAVDEAGNTFSVTKPLKKDTVAENVQNLQAAPNEDNNAIVLTWEILRTSILSKYTGGTTLPIIPTDGGYIKRVYLTQKHIQTQM